MTHLRTHPRFHQDKHSEHVSWLSDWKCAKPLERTQGFSKIWPSDLVFDPTWPIFKVIQDFIKTKVLTKFYSPKIANHEWNQSDVKSTESKSSTIPPAPTPTPTSKISSHLSRHVFNKKSSESQLDLERDFLQSTFSSMTLASSSGSASTVLKTSKKYSNLTHYHTIPHSDTLKIYSCGKDCEKRRNCL